MSSSSSSDDQPPVEFQLAIAKEVILQLGLPQMHRSLSDETSSNSSRSCRFSSVYCRCSPLAADCLARLPLPLSVAEVFVARGSLSSANCVLLLVASMSAQLGLVMNCFHILVEATQWVVMAAGYVLLLLLAFSAY